MPKITTNGKQYTVTIPIELIRIMGWNKDTEVIICKYPDKNMLFIEEIKRKNEKNKK